MTRDEAKNIFTIHKNRQDEFIRVDKRIYHKVIDIIYDGFEKNCEACRFNGPDNGESWQEGYNEAMRVMNEKNKEE